LLNLCGFYGGWRAGLGLFQKEWQVVVGDLEEALPLPLLPLFLSEKIPLLNLIKKFISQKKIIGKVSS